MANKPSTTLIIGLGGSGAWTAVHVKRQLYDAYDNKMPDNVAITVLDTSTNKGNYTTGGVAIKRQPGMGMGMVAIEDHEFSHVGGDIYQLTQDIARTDKYPHMKKWFMAQRYLDEISPDIFSLEKGAGQFRQLGRMAVFRDLIAPNDSKVMQILEQKLVQLGRRHEGTIAVMIVGSIVGGTGSGLFLDIAHLVRKVAERGGIKVKIRGFFYLPAAFRTTLDLNKLNEAHPRAFGALRELRRFLLNKDYKIGYPMFYHTARGGADQTIFRGRQNAQLYDYVYLIDGEGEQTMNAVELNRGSAAVVADAMMAYIDHHFSQYQDDYDTNIGNSITINRQNFGQNAYIGTFGSHSIILPVQQMIEGWTFELSKTLIEKLAPANDYNKDGDVVGGLSYRKNPEQKNVEPSEAVAELLKSKFGLIDVYANEKREVKPLSLWQEALKIHELGVQKGDRVPAELASLGLESWKQMLVPTSIQADPKIQAAVVDTQNTINTTIYDREDAAPSDKRKPADPDNDWRAIGQASERFINAQLGAVTSGGGRDGGVYKQALDRFVGLQVERFAEFIHLYIHHTLNGTLQTIAEPIDAKSGKLGWLLAMMSEMHKVFAKATELLDGVRIGRGQVGGDRSAAIQQQYDNAAREMREQAGQRKTFGTDPYLKAQKDYLEAVDRYIRHYRTEFTRSAVNEAISGIRDILATLLEELERWQRIVATDVDGLHARLNDGSRRIKGERSKSEKVENHTVIRDDDWEKRKYEEYVKESNALDKIFGAWRWATEVIQDGRGKRSIVIKAAIVSKDDNNNEETVVELRRDMRGSWHEENQRAVLNYARNFFRSALRKESITKYLMQERYPDAPDKLGDYLYDRSGSLLAVPAAGLRTRTRIDLLLGYDSGDDNENSFLDKVASKLTSRRGFGGTGDVGGGDNKNAQSNSLSKRLKCDDPFRLTLLNSTELIPLDQINAWMNAEGTYITTKWDVRQLYHIFPAEILAAEYEERLRDLSEAPRRMSDKVVMLLEDEQRIIDFLQLLAHGIIFKNDNHTDNAGRDSLMMYQMRLPEKRNQNNDWWLTMPDQNEPSLLDAMITYVVIGDDVRSKEPSSNYSNSIHDREEDILKYLAEVRKTDAIPRINDDKLALDDDELRGWLEVFLPPLDEDGNEVYDDYTQEDQDTFIEMAELVVRHDILHGLANYVENELPAIKQNYLKYETSAKTNIAHDAAEQARQLWDLYSVILLALRRQMDTLRNRVERKANSRLGNGGRI